MSVPPMYLACIIIKKQKRSLSSKLEKDKERCKRLCGATFVRQCLTTSTSVCIGLIMNIDKILSVSCRETFAVSLLPRGDVPIVFRSFPLSRPYTMPDNGGCRHSSTLAFQRFLLVAQESFFTASQHMGVPPLAHSLAVPTIRYSSLHSCLLFHCNGILRSFRRERRAIKNAHSPSLWEGRRATSWYHLHTSQPHELRP